MLDLTLDDVAPVLGISRSRLSDLENPRDPEAPLSPHIEKRYLKALDTAAREKIRKIAAARVAYRQFLAEEG